MSYVAMHKKEKCSEGKCVVEGNMSWDIGKNMSECDFMFKVNSRCCDSSLLVTTNVTAAVENFGPTLNIVLRSSAMNLETIDVVRN